MFQRSQETSENRTMSEQNVVFNFGIDEFKIIIMFFFGILNAIDIYYRFIFGSMVLVARDTTFNEFQ